MFGRTHPGFLALAATVLVLGGLGVLLYLEQRPDNPNPDGKPLVVYCAAGLQKPMRAIAAEYEREFGQRVELQFAGSNVVLANLSVARVGDLFVPADESYIRTAREKGLLAEVLPVAVMRAVLLVPSGNPKGIRKLDDLWQKDVQLAQANPDAAAIGKGTRELFTRLGLWEKLAKQTVTYTGTVHDAANTVKTGAVDAAIVWDTTAFLYPGQEVVRLPELAEVKGEVNAAVLNFSEVPTAALRFARYVTAPEKGLPHFREEGFTDVAEGDAWAEVPELVVYSGAMLRPAIEQTIAEFERREGVKVTTKYNGCGILVSEMKAGDRPDVYFSCDVSFMKQVKDAAHGFDLFGEDTVVSGNQLVIAVPKGNPHGITDLKSLGKPGLKVGVGHEQNCALGVITQETLRLSFLKQNNVFARVLKNIVVRYPTGDALINSLRTGALDAAVVYRSNLAYCEDEVEGIPVTGIDCAVPNQPVAIGRQTKYPHLAKRLMAALQSDESRRRFEEVGFTWKLQEKSR